MNSTEKIEFLRKKYIELNTISYELEQEFPDKSFKMDGIVVGNIVEEMAACIYGIKLYSQSEKTHDGEVDGKKVQVKGTQGLGYIIIKEEPEYLIVELLDRNSGELKEIYNGPGKYVWERLNLSDDSSGHMVKVSSLSELDRDISDSDRISQLIPIQKYRAEKQATIVKNINDKKSRSGKGKTTKQGYINKNNQENLGCLNKPGTHYNQISYQMRCNSCRHMYEANGCDIAIRRCPVCG